MKPHKQKSFTSGKEKAREHREAGFTLVEVIVTIVATAILGVIFMNFMGTAMSKSTRAVLNVEAEANAQRLIEQIASDYAVEINKADPSSALDTIFNRTYAASVYGASVDKRYITFNLSGDQATSGTPTDTLKITVTWNVPGVPEVGGGAITTLLTNSRRSAGDAAVAF